MLNCSNVGLDNRNKIGAIIVSVLLILVGFFFFMGDDEEEEEIEENNIPADTRITDDSLEEVSNSTNDDESTEDYQLSRAFDLILALNLINLKTTQ